MTTTAAYMLTVGSNHTIELPKEVTVSATVAVIVVPNEQAEAARHALYGDVGGDSQGSSAARTANFRRGVGCAQSAGLSHANHA
jgi:hypothetical protein